VGTALALGFGLGVAVGVFPVGPAIGLELGFTTGLGLLPPPEHPAPNRARSAKVRAERTRTPVDET
jgi:hypothetical protein